MADLTGQTFGQYTLHQRIGKGGMATVYRARQASMDRDVAIKVMGADLIDNAEFIARFEREAHVIAQLQHPHILPVYDFGRSGDFVFLVMRLVAGGTLSARLRKTTLSVREANRFVQQIASALEYAHRRGVIHRDLKPNNVLLDEMDNVYLTDFGIAKMLAAASSGHNLTATGSVMGTPAYMAPEQWRSEPVDARTDVYALGVILYEMLLGALPFRAETPFGMMYKHFDMPPPRPRLVNPDLPEEIEWIMLRALAKTPHDRYPSAGQLAGDFDGVVQAMSTPVATQTLPRATPDQIMQATQAAWSAPRARATILSSGLGPDDLPLPPVFRSTGAVRRQPAPARGALFWGGMGLLVIAVIFIGALIIISQARNDDRNDRPVTTPVGVADRERTSTAEAAEIAETATGVASGSPSPTDDTRSPGVTPATATVTPPTHTPTIRPTATRTPMPSITPDLTGTAQAVNLAVETLIAQRLTEVAASWTDIPSPTIPPPPTRTPYPTATATESPTPEARCTLPERMQTNQGGRTTLDPDALTSVRAAPDLAAQTLRRIPPGQMFWVTGGPVCTDSVAWWAVEGYDVDGRWSGWIGEGRDGTYWIEPYDTGPIDCPGAKPPRMTPGEQGRITLYPDLPSRIRSAPHITDDSTILGKLDPGTTFEVISGPVCKNGYRWWYVDAGRYQGWVAEGDERDYWIEPWS